MFGGQMVGAKIDDMVNGRLEGYLVVYYPEDNETIGFYIHSNPQPDDEVVCGPDGMFWVWADHTWAFNDADMPRIEEGQKTLEEVVARM